MWRMKDKMNCPICRQEVFSELGRRCKMCGMVVVGSDDFCCKICMRKYNTISRSVR